MDLIGPDIYKPTGIHSTDFWNGIKGRFIEDLILDKLHAIDREKTRIDPEHNTGEGPDIHIPANRKLKRMDCENGVFIEIRSVWGAYDIRKSNLTGEKGAIVKFDGLHHCLKIIIYVLGEGASIQPSAIRAIISRQISLFTDPDEAITAIRSLYFDALTQWPMRVFPNGSDNMPNSTTGREFRRDIYDIIGRYEPLLRQPIGYTTDKSNGSHIGTVPNISVFGAKSLRMTRHRHMDYESSYDIEGTQFLDRNCRPTTYRS